MTNPTDHSARINFKQAIIVAIITSVTTIVVTLISTKGNKKDDPVSENCTPYIEKVDELKAEMEKMLSAENLSDISNVFFKKGDKEHALKDSLRNVVRLANRHLEDQNHYAYNLFLLKKLLLKKARGNINTRIEGDGDATYKLIQKILKNIEFYTGELTGDRQDTYLALKKFQLKRNEATPDYFEENNLGILGNKTYIALMEYYEQSN